MPIRYAARPPRATAGYRPTPGARHTLRSGWAALGVGLLALTGCTLGSPAPSRPTDSTISTMPATAPTTKPTTTSSGPAHPTLPVPTWRRAEGGDSGPDDVQATIPPRAVTTSVPFLSPLPAGRIELTGNRLWISDPGRLVLAVELPAQAGGGLLGARLRVEGATLLVDVPPSPATETLVLRTATRAISSVGWSSSAERSLRVLPNWPARGWLTGGEAVWAELIERLPEVDSPSMHDQLVCHVQFAPAKATWNLEPRRPVVGYAATVAAACNPGDMPDPS